MPFRVTRLKPKCVLVGSRRSFSSIKRK